MKDTLVPGLVRELRFTVTPAKTVPALYPESPGFRTMPEVFATGFLVGLLEWACVELITPHLEEGEQSLGTHIAVSHEAATPPGFEVTARAKLVALEGRRLRFEVEATDGVDLIARGTHERAVIQRSRFDAKVAAKAEAAKGKG
jgi:fluoroacetyl-CoA thioesterase